MTSVRSPASPAGSSPAIPPKSTPSSSCRASGIGNQVTGRWFQLSTQDVPPAGAFVSEAGVTLSQDNLTQEGMARVSLDLFSNADALPLGDWVVRIYVNGEFVRTMAFVIIPTEQQSGAGGGQPTPQASATQAAQPEPTQPPGEQPTQPPGEQPTPQPETYTVQSGDTLTIIAEQFKSPDETTEDFVARLAELNNLAPGSILFVGQVLKIPQ